eukprot:COSAG06_NODE_7575_length_2454_cov_1.818259_3_plen_58_part_00
MICRYDSIAGVLPGALMCLQVYASTPHVVQPVIEVSDFPSHVVMQEQQQAYARSQQA